jgi:hypothetical protein
MRKCRFTPGVKATQGTRERSELQGEAREHPCANLGRSAQPWDGPSAEASPATGHEARLSCCRGNIALSAPAVKVFCRQSASIFTTRAIVGRKIRSANNESLSK